LIDFPENKLWVRPAGLAYPGFHLQHIGAVIARLFTYAHEESVDEVQMGWLNGAVSQRRVDWNGV
jgi:hypothetical protein